MLYDYDYDLTLLKGIHVYSLVRTYTILLPARGTWHTKYTQGFNTVVRSSLRLGR